MSDPDYKAYIKSLEDCVIKMQKEIKELQLTQAILLAEQKPSLQQRLDYWKKWILY